MKRSLYSLAVFVLFAQGLVAQPVRVIFDTDLMGDVDDVGCVALLHALADAGEAEILGMGISSTHEHSAPCLSALNQYFGRPDIPIGQLKGTGFGKRSKYVKQIAEEFPRGLASSADAPDVTALYRRLLAGQPDQGVVLITVGMLTNVRDLLKSGSDNASPLSGAQLARAKVRLWVCMGGRYPDGREYNFHTDRAASAYALEHWPGPAVFSGFEIGDRIRTGARTAELPNDSPVRRSYELYNGLKNRQSWDQTAVWYAIRGTRDHEQDFWTLRQGGRVVMRGEEGANAWVDDPKGLHAYLVQRADPALVARAIESLMLHQPKSAAPATP